MDSNLILKIEKRPLSVWLVYWIALLPVLWGSFFTLLSLPSIMKYTADVAWVVLFCLMVFRKNLDVKRNTRPILIWAIVFLVFCSITYVANYQSIVYFLWGFRNNFRFYIFFFSLVIYLKEKDVTNIFKFMDLLFWINLPITLIQYFFAGYKQDYLGGIFGVESGANAFTIIFFSIVLSNSVLKYMNKNEKFSLCAAKCVVALFISALAELKFFFVFFVVILVVAALFTKFSWRKLFIFIVGALVVSVTSRVLVSLFGFESFLSLEYIWEVATQDHYSSEETVNRLSAIPTLANMIMPEAKYRFFGLGLGNCDTSAFAICETPFHQTYGYLRYNYFSSAFLFLEVGYIGLALYILFFVICYFLIRKRIKEKLCDDLCGQVALIMIILSLILIFYNASLRAEQGYLVYLILALPFINKKQWDWNN